MANRQIEQGVVTTKFPKLRRDVKSKMLSSKMERTAKNTLNKKYFGKIITINILY